MAIVFKSGIAAESVVIMKPAITIIPVVIAADDLDGKTKLINRAKDVKNIVIPKMLKLIIKLI